jgi:integrase
MTKSILRRAATILAAKGGLVTDITVGDCLELEELQAEGMRRTNRGAGLYAALYSMGVLGADAPATLRAFATQGQLSPEQMLGRYGIECGGLQRLLNDYLLERAPSLDHTTLRSLAATLGRLFWRDLEIHHPGICSLNLAPDVAAAWKQRVLVKTTRVTDPSGRLVETRHLRSNGRAELGQVRAFYLDIAQWAMEEPARWGPWAAPSPVRREDLARVKEIRRRKSRMDQRTRERLPALPALVARVHAQARAGAERLAAAAAVGPGEQFTCRGEVLHRAPARSGPTAKTWSEDPVTGVRRDLSGEEDRAFWTWAAIETLRHTGIRIEELCELSHHSLVQYTPPTSTGSTPELIPLLQIAPSKTDTERLLVVSPELADVLAAVIARVRQPSGAVAAVASYDSHERVWNPPMPLLFQRRFGGGNRSIPSGTIRDWICQAIPDHADSPLRDSAGQPLRFTPHDFRRIFITDAVLHGMPPHIAQLVAGHRDINTTMGYKAVYPEEAINGHRAFIARRRALRPAEEYRTPTDAEWEEFLGHFERRKVSLGTCGRSYATPCVHEHSCLRCPLLRPDPGQRQRLIDVRDNLLARIDEARREGWLGEVEGLQISLAGARAKLAQLDQMALPSPRTPINLGIPTRAQV